MKLYQYNHCPFCVRVDMVANYKDIVHEKIYLLSDDEETCFRLVNAKKVPILECDDGSAFAESIDIAEYLDAVGSSDKVIRPRENIKSYSQILDAVQLSIQCLLFPRNIIIGLPEFATQSARSYFKLKKESIIHCSFEEALKESPHHKKQVEIALSQFPLLPLPSEYNNTISWDDILLFPRLRNLTMVAWFGFSKANPHLFRRSFHSNLNSHLLSFRDLTIMFHKLATYLNAVFNTSIKTIIISVLTLLSTFLLADPLRIAVASNFTAPMQKLAPIFEKETGQQIQLSFGSSGKFFAQIQNGAPFDVFLSADQAKPSKLVQKGLALQESQIIYAKGALALWSAKLDSVEPIEQTLKKANKIAIANPKLAPYGKAAEETLKKLGLWSSLKSKLVQGENIGQTYQFVYTKNAAVGFVALSQVRAGDIKGSFWKIPSSYHSDIKQAAVVLSKSHQQKLAESFLAFLMRHDIQEKIAGFGYQTSVQ